MKRRCIITGTDGFIGHNLLKQLLLDGWDVVRKIPTSDQPFSNDLCGIDVVFHIGANSNTLETDLSKIMFQNYQYTKDIVDMAEYYGSTKVVYASSAAIYGDDIANSNMPDGTLLELFDRPNNIYAWTKLLGEDYGRARLNNFVSLRYFNVYGPGEHKKGRMASMAWHAWKKQPDKISLFEGKPRRDFVYIKDVVSATIAAADSPGGIYHVGTGRAETFESLVTGMGTEYDYLDPDTKKPKGYQEYTRCDTNCWLPEWSPKYDVTSGTADYVENLKFNKEYKDVC
tara:strand:- start:3544 stop:4398 length:855 start_codon:yes stop_codon:yes gene_type:complete